MVELVLTRHARLAVERRGIKRAELRACVYRPDRVEAGKAWRTEKRRKIGVGEERSLVAVVRPTRRKLLLITAYIEEARPDASVS